MSVNPDCILSVKIPDVVPTQHYFSEGVYAKQMALLKGHYAVTHKHCYDHLSILAQGKAIVTIGNQQAVYEAPTCITILKGEEHRIDALEDSTWFCIHATSVADPDDVEIGRS